MEWISVKDRLPEKEKLVAVSRDIESKQIFVTRWSDEDELWMDMNKVTHWLELPPHPLEVSTPPGNK